jgi:hypothetical protein
MTQEKLTLAAIAALTFLGMNCTSPTGSTYPMTVGSVWNRSVTLLSGTPAAALDTVETETQTTTAVAKVTLINGREVTKFENDLTIYFKQQDTTVASTTYSYVAEVGDTIFMYSDQSDTVGVPKMRATPAVGQTWSEGSSGVATVVGQEDVTVAAGTYKSAWKVLRASIIADVYEWYAPGTGLVKEAYDDTTLGIERVYNSELTSATIK